MVNADTAPALPWGASNERENRQQIDARRSELSRSLTTAEFEPDHTGTPQVEAWPSSGSTIEVNNSFYLFRAGTHTSATPLVSYSVKEEPLTVCAL